MPTYRGLPPATYTLSGPFGDPSYTQLMDKIAVLDRAEELGLLYLIDDRRHFRGEGFLATLRAAHLESPWGSHVPRTSAWPFMRVSGKHIRTERPLPLGAFIKNANRALQRQLHTQFGPLYLHLEDRHESDVPWGGKLLETFHQGIPDYLAARIHGHDHEYLEHNPHVLLKAADLKEILAQARSLGAPWITLYGSTEEKGKWASSEGLYWTEYEVDPAVGSDWEFLIDVDSGALIPTFGYYLETP